MAITTRRVSIANPARRRKQLSPKQIRAGFGGKRRQAAIKAKRSAHRPRAQKRNTAHRRRTSPRPVRRNLGEQVLLTLGNPASKRRQVARHRKRTKKHTTASVHHRRRSSQSNPRRRYSARRTNRAVRHNRRCGNPMGGAWGSEITHALYIIAGAVGSKMGAQLALGSSNTGFLGYGANLAAGGLLAWAAKAVTKSSDAAKGIFAGAVVQVILRLITDYTPFGQYASLQGVGDYMASNWVTPQRYVDGLNTAQVEIPTGWGGAPVVMASSGANANAVAAGSDGMGGW
jgi:hypothetical protein